MSSLLTVLLPGLAQMQAGQWRKAATMFLVALFLGPPTGGIGWIFSGLWSLMDARGSFATPPTAAPAAPARAELRAPAEAPAPAKGSAAPWIFKFAVLGVGASIALYSISQGRALETLKFLGIELSFASSVGQLAGGESSNAGVTTANVLPETPSSGFMPPSNDPKAAFRTENTDALPTNASISGNWRGSTGSTYGIAESGSNVTIIETSHFLGFITVETGRCDGTISNGVITASCSMSNGVTGTISLSPGADGASLVGKFTAPTIGRELPLIFQR